MRTALSNLLTRSAVEDPRELVLSGDHGYALFDEIRRARPGQFINVGIAEQGLVGLAAGLARVGFRPTIYGLASFVPLRVVEQIKLDLCFSRLPVLILGDGAGLVYSTLGASHQSGEDVACLRPLPHLRVYSPCDAEELRACYREARAQEVPCYIRIGKSDRPAVNRAPLPSAKPHLVREDGRAACLVAAGSMVSISAAIAGKLGLSCLSIPRIKPLDEALPKLLSRFSKLIVLEEHSAAGGLASAILEQGAQEDATPLPPLRSIALAERFTELCGSYQFALSEHGMSDSQLLERVSSLIKKSLSAAQS